MVEMPKKLQFWSLEKLKPYERNSREHSPEQIKRIAESMKTFGFTNPILVDGDNGIIAGHGRLAAAKELGLDKVPVIQLEHLTDEQRRAYIIADNRLAELSTWNNEILKSELSELQELGFDLELIGFDQEQLTEIMPPEKSEPLTDEDAVPEVEDAPVVKRGDTWILGNHRLRCGDSTSAEDVALLMNGEKADMVFTDPPYGMNLDTDYSKMGQAGINHRKVLNDDKYFDPKFIFNLFANVKELFLFGADYYCWDLPKNGSWIVWDKRSSETNIGQLDGAFGSSFELCWSKNKHARDICRVLRETGYFARGDEKKVHPTQKPVSLAVWFFDRWGKDCSYIVDLFGGSGSTLIACEKTGRKCFMMELDEKYVQVIIRRWQEYTGKDAYHAETGETFNSLASK